MNIEDYESYSDILKNNDESLDKKLIENDYSSQLGSFAYMPKKFLGIDTSLFGSTNTKLFKVHPFLQLKEKLTGYQKENEMLKDLVESQKEIIKLLKSSKKQY